MTEARNSPDGAGGEAARPARLETNAANRLHWGDPGNYPEGWDQRASLAAELIAPQAAILDLGCGRMALREMLPEGRRYVPAALTARNDDAAVVDLDAG